MLAAASCRLVAIALAVLPQDNPMRDLIHRWAADEAAIARFHDLPHAAHRGEVLDAFHADWLKRLEGMNYDALPPDGRVDYHLLRGEILYRRREIQEDARDREELAGLVPFAGHVLLLEEARRRREPLDGRAAAGWMSETQREVKRIRGLIERALDKNAPLDGVPLDPESAWRAADRVEQMRGVLERWHQNVAAFDPEVTWWVQAPYDGARTALGDYAKFLREKVAKASGADDDPLFGRPIGREALASALAHEVIVYGPEELIAMAERHAAWVIGEMKRASAEMDLGADWRRALEKVKSQAVPPGRQLPLIETIARDAIAFCDRHDLVTIPALCRELWRLDMISGAAQRHMPFASYGGLGMNVAYPTVDMDHERKLMSMRGNNVHFSRLVTPHELIPGHHLQAFVAERERSWRKRFSTPFHVEGWAVYGEMLFYRLGFAQGPEDRIGALLWRLHRCARVIVSLRYHLGEMQPPAMIRYLVDEVGLEEDGATAEVRRYLRGGYGPLYQCGYLIGALQIDRLREEMQVGKKISERAFHDALLANGPIPVELARAALTGAVLKRDHAASWRFAGP